MSGNRIRILPADNSGTLDERRNRPLCYKVYLLKTRRTDGKTELFFRETAERTRQETEKGRETAKESGQFGGTVTGWFVGTGLNRLCVPQCAAT
ncbi:MAG: hypothetical protein AB7E95_03780 [Kiritimatiellales bacterium]